MQGSVSRPGVLRVLVVRGTVVVLQADVGRQLARATELPADEGAERRALGRLGEAGVDLLEFVLHRLDELHGADEGQFVGDLGLERHVFADVETRNPRLDRPELAAILRRRFGLEVVHVEVAGATRETDHDDGARLLGLGGLRLEAQDVRQRQAAQSHHAHAQEVAAVGVRSIADRHGGCFVRGGRRVRLRASSLSSGRGDHKDHSLATQPHSRNSIRSAATRRGSAWRNPKRSLK